MKTTSRLSPSCPCGTRTYPSEAKALYALDKITSLRESGGGTATWSAPTGVYPCPSSGKWHLREPEPVLGFTDEVKAQARDRSKGRCEACGCWLGEKGGQIQHRDARGMGGSRDPLTNSVVNGARLCGTPKTGCHGRCEARDEHMKEMGFWLEPGQNPADTPIVLHGVRGWGVRRWLTPEGGYSAEPPEGVAA